MKRCPQCEFIYNDDQNLCDMDGRALVYDDALATLPDSSLPANDLQIPKSRLRVLTMPALAGFVLAALICLGYYAAPRLNAKPETRGSSETRKLKPVPAAETAPAATDSSKPTTEPDKSADPSKPIAAVVDPSLSATPAERTATTKPNDRLTISRRLAPLPRVPPLPRLPTAKVRSTTPESSVSAPERSTEVTSANQKKESTVRSLLKKTGRILKKPFKR